MSALRVAVYVAPPIPILGPNGKHQNHVWSPISCTLIYSSTEAVLVDTPITTQQNLELIEWIKKIAPGCKLRYVYITHGHGDHFFGIPLLMEHFPGVEPIATAPTVRHMEQQVKEPLFEQVWGQRFPGLIPRPFVLAEPLPESNEFEILGIPFQAIEIGHADTYDSTFLWVPDLRLAVCGDVVYGQVHQMLMEANTKAKREEWIRAIEKVESLNPAYVIPGHRQAEEVDGVWHLASTKKYLIDFGKVLEKGPKSPREIITEMLKLYPERFNPGTLQLSAIGAFMVPKEEWNSLGAGNIQGVKL
ncbi:Metallo-hydrolase/oxidoreductase [Bimuria novae-zelandiae CBS 107.79]|uniref:Metallo-hydrolase/oxidoreductase n=1 Tax=Bimuria novae-zelandiae CBS 107.79 TaxID=1447943 RepID=A0A6A5UNX1_9PLEO|nr:Metallo-hydrolase/oxidoreductase [Bimuria novae-zelandiae CBS 107.79]